MIKTMLKNEQNYDSRKRLCKPHARIFVAKDSMPSAEEYALKKEITLSVKADGLVAKTAARDFKDYLKTAFGIKAVFTEENADILAFISDELLQPSR